MAFVRRRMDKKLLIVTLLVLAAYALVALWIAGAFR